MKNIYKIGIAAGIATGIYFIYRKFKTMKVSKIGIEFIKNLEGIKRAAYKDSKGLWTIGVGHLIQPNENYLLTKTLTDLEINSLLRKDIIKFENAVNDSLFLPVRQFQFDSLVSIAFNIGPEGFENSTIVKKINSKATPEEISKAIAMWNKPEDIQGRRAKEIRLFNTGLYSNLTASKEENKYFA